MPLTDSSTQTELSPSFFKFNPMTDPFQPDLVVNQGSSSTNDNGYFPDQNTAINIPFVPDAQGASHDFNFDLGMSTNDASMDYMPMTDLVLTTPTIESLELSIQILWAEHQMRTQYLEQQLADAVAVSEALRKDVDAMAEWIQRIYDHLDSSLASSSHTGNGSPKCGE